MFFRCLSLNILMAAWLMGADGRILRVCADPNNLPFSNQAGEGLENHLAELIAKALNTRLQYTWYAERRSFLRNSLQAGLCDVVMGVPSALDSVATTAPYYRSSYVFVERADRRQPVVSLADPRLGQLRIGIHQVGEDFAPPAHLLAREGLNRHLVGYSLYGPFGQTNPPSRLIHAVAAGEVDLAIVWGPFAGYFDKFETVALRATPVSPDRFGDIPFTYRISAAVRKGDDGLLSEIQAALTRECAEIHDLLKQYGIPELQEGLPRCDSSQPASVSSR